jgi:outer membrane biosynthesis protein TonB
MPKGILKSVLKKNMSERNKHTKKWLPEFIRYRYGKMTGNEKNSFERDLQKDPFAEEAAEGFDMLSPEDLEKDMASLNRKLKRRVIRKRRMLIYRIAASVAVLMVISSVFVVIDRNRQTQQNTAELSEQKVLTIPEGEALKKPEQAAGKTERTPALTGKKADMAAPQKRATESEKGYVAAPVAEALHAEEPEKARVENIRTEKSISVKRAAEPVSALPYNRSAGKTVLSGKVLSADDKQPIAGASVVVKGTHTGITTDRNGNFSISIPDTGQKILVASYIGMKQKEFEARKDTGLQVELQPDAASLSEVVVMGYGTRKTSGNPKGYIPPEPVTGRKAFENYIDDNIIRPDTLVTRKRVVVVLSFRVGADGTVDSIRVVRSPGNQFSGEAIRLLKSGPAWKPATEDGKSVNDVVTIGIVFRNK